MKTVEVRRYAGQATASEALAMALDSIGEEAVVFVSTPTSWSAALAATVALQADTFELVVFGNRGQLRWLRTGSSGRAALTTVDDAAEPARLAALGAPRSEMILERRYLMWGSVERVSKIGRAHV